MQEQQQTLELSPRHPPTSQLHNYTIKKLTLSGDYRSKNKLGDSYLLCHMNSRQSCEYRPELVTGSIVQYEQRWCEDGNCYEVFPLGQRMTWMGDAEVVGRRSQMQCLALLYSAVRGVVRPLVQLATGINGVGNYIVLDNFWVRDHNCFMLLCKRKDSRAFYKTQQVNRFKHRTLAVQDGGSTREQIILSAVGTVFWEAFFPDIDSIQSGQRSTLREIVKAMIKKDLGLIQLTKIMEEKSAKKKFVSSFKNNQTIDPYGTRSKSKRRRLDNDVENRTIDPVSPGKSHHLFKNSGRNPMTNSNRQRSNKKRMSIDVQSGVFPPGFTETKRSKRFSLFQSKRPSKRYDHSSIDSKYNTISVSAGNYYSNTIQTPSMQPSPNNYATLTHSKQQKKRRQLKNHQKMNDKQIMLKHTKSKIADFEGRSLEKVKSRIQSIERVSSSEEKIDDSKFRSQLKEKHERRKKNINQIMTFTSKQLSRIDIDSESVGMAVKSIQFSSNEVRLQGYVEEGQEGRYGAGVKVFNQNVIGEQRDQSYWPMEEDQYFLEDRDREDRERERQRERKKYERERDQREREREERERERWERERHERERDERRRTEERRIIEEREKEDKRRAEERERQDRRRQRQERERRDEIIKQERQRQQSRMFTKRDVTDIPINKQHLPQRHGQGVRNDEKSSVDRFAMRPEDSQQKKPSDPIHDNKEKGNYFSAANDIQDQLPQVGELVSTIRPKKKETEKGRKSVEETPKLQSNKSEKVVKNMFPSKNTLQLDDQLEEVQLSMASKPIINPQSPEKMASNMSAKILPSPPVLQQKRQPQRQKEIPRQQHPTSKSNHPKREQQMPEQSHGKGSTGNPGKQRVKTNQSNTSSTINKSVRKQIDEYIYMINKMGEAVAKTAKMSKKLSGIDWYVGVYFLYKRFFYERKKIEKCLLEQLPKLTRNGQFGMQQWKEWLSKGERDTLLNKCQEDNKNIEESLKKMMKKMENMNLPASILLTVPITKNMGESSMLAIEHIMNEYDQIVRMKLLDDPELFVHINQMINALYVMSQLDGKMEEKKGVMEFGNVKRSKKELKEIVKTILNFYYQDQD